MHNIQKTIYIMLLLSIMAFLTGFLQSTKFEFVIYISYFVLMLGGIKLITITLKSNLSVLKKAFLLLTGFTLTVYFLFFLLALIVSLASKFGITEFLNLTEGFLYLNSLLYLIGTVGSLVMLRFKKDRNK